MSFGKRGFKDGVNKNNARPPKRDGLFGSSILESNKSENRNKAYENGYNQGQNKRRKNMNFIQRLLD